jgi:hypothetical protein
MRQLAEKKRLPEKKLGSFADLIGQLSPALFPEENRNEKMKYRLDLLRRINNSLKHQPKSAFDLLDYGCSDSDCMGEVKLYDGQKEIMTLTKNKHLYKLLALIIYCMGKMKDALDLKLMK